MPVDITFVAHEGTDRVSITCRGLPAEVGRAVAARFDGLPFNYTTLSELRSSARKINRRMETQIRKALEEYTCHGLRLRVFVDPSDSVSTARRPRHRRRRT